MDWRAFITTTGVIGATEMTFFNSPFWLQKASNDKKMPNPRFDPQ